MIAVALLLAAAARVCTDGFLGELWDEIDVQMLGEQWEAAMRFAPLHSDTAFRRLLRSASASGSVGELAMPSAPGRYGGGVAPVQA